MGILSKLLNRAPSQDEFAALVIRRLAKNGLVDIEYSSEKFSLRVKGASASGTIFLYNAYQNYCAAARREKNAVLSRYLNSFSATHEFPDDFDSVRPYLMPVIRDYRYASLAQLAVDANNGAKQKPLAERPFAVQLSLGLAYDTEHTIQHFTVEKMAAWGVGIDVAFAAAVENLRDRTAPDGFKRIGNGVYSGEWGDYYDAARMTLLDFFYRLDLNGSPVVFVPNRNALLVTGIYDQAGIGFILKHGGDSHIKESYPLSPNLYILNDSKWEYYEPKEISLRNQLASIQKQREVLDYGQQERWLNIIYEREKIDVFVAGCGVYQRDDGSFFTRCVWSNGVDSLLPKTDIVAIFINPGERDGVPLDVLMISWDNLQSKAGELLEAEDDLEPRRYRARVFPDASKIEALRSIAEPRKG